jgi:hypothetical protein
VRGGVQMVRAGIGKGLLLLARRHRVEAGFLG